MEKSEFIQQFQELNTLIEIAILSQDFDKVTRIDESRRKLLKQFAADNEPSEDKVFFEALEACAEENARAISEMKGQMIALAKNTNSRIKQLHGYMA